MEFEKGRTYYIIRYADRDFTMPSIEPVIFIGENAHIRCVDNDEDTYQFQDTVSYVRHGYVMDMSAEERNECRVDAISKNGFSDVVTTLSGVADVVSKALRKSKELNEPKLRELKGNWVTARTEIWEDIIKDDPPDRS